MQHDPKVTVLHANPTMPTKAELHMNNAIAPGEHAQELRYLAIYRHAPTKKGSGRGRGSHLSAEGVGLAFVCSGTAGDEGHFIHAEFQRVAGVRKVE